MKVKKIFMVALSSLFLFSPAILLTASENSIDANIVITHTEQRYFDILQSTLNNIGMPAIPLNFDVDSENSSELLSEILRDIESPIFNAMRRIRDFHTDGHIVIEGLQHDFLENLIVTIDTYGVSSLGFSICLINIGLMTAYNHVYVDGIWVPRETSAQVNPYNRFRRDSVGISDVIHSFATVGKVYGLVWYFEREDGARFVQSNSESFIPAIIDNRLLSHISFNHFTLRNNGTRVPYIRFDFTAYHIGSPINSTTSGLRVHL